MVRDWSWMAGELDYPDSWEQGDPDEQDAEPIFILPPPLPTTEEGFLPDDAVVSIPPPVTISDTWVAILETVTKTTRPER